VSLERCLRWRRWWLGAIGGWRPRARVWALAVVVIDVDAQNMLELASSEDQQPVQAFGPCGPHEALGVSVGLRRAERRLDNVDAFRAEDLVEAGGELGVAIADQET
jgi:hypothetical protein